MPKNLLSFSLKSGVKLSQQQAEQLITFAQCVWGKKDFLNLTSAQTFEEIIFRHICDALTAAAQVQNLGLTNARLADVGAGCGYIGMSLAVVFPQAKVTLIESLEKRCKFMHWASLQVGLQNVTVKQTRLGQGTNFAFDLVTERAMGPLPEIADICLGATKKSGFFMAFQGEHPQTTQVHTLKGTCIQEIPYHLPCDQTRRHLVLFQRNYA